MTHAEKTHSIELTESTSLILERVHPAYGRDRALVLLEDGDYAGSFDSEVISSELQLEFICESLNEIAGVAIVTDVSPCSEHQFQITFSLPFGGELTRFLPKPHLSNAERTNDLFEYAGARPSDLSRLEYLEVPVERDSSATDGWRVRPIDRHTPDKWDPEDRAFEDKWLFKKRTWFCLALFMGAWLYGIISLAASLKAGNGIALVSVVALCCAAIAALLPLLPTDHEFDVAPPS